VPASTAVPVSAAPKPAKVAPPYSGANKDSKFLFPNLRGDRLSPDSVQHLVSKYVAAAAKTCPTLGKKRVSPHVLRHTTAMELLQSGVDRSVIALWLGHESLESTQIYLDANLAIKEGALKKTRPVGTKIGRYKPGDQLLAFLKNL
jgi:site-specific recombinase XerD